MKNLDLHIFPRINKEEWLQLAEKQLKGANPTEELAWKNDANISLDGYYDHQDMKGLEYLEEFFSSIPSHRWKLYERIDCTQLSAANESALEALMGGCDGIIFLAPKSGELQALLTDINTEICDVSIISNDLAEVHEEFSGFHLIPNGNCCSTHKVNPVDQIADLLASFNQHSHIHRTAHSDFFLEIASIRALRFLLDERGHKNIHIHSQIPLHESDEHQWFLNTTAGLASILGGSHSIDLSTASGDTRISRNTGNLIREESGIEDYTDQCGGSYYIEVLTDKIIKQVTENLKQ